MIMVTFIVIICFAWLYNDTKFFDRVGSERVGMVYGKQVARAQYLRVARKFEICQMLGLNELWSGLGFTGNPRSRGDLEENFIWNSFVLRHEADALGIEPTDDEVIEAIEKLPAFETNGVYDSSKYNVFVEKGLMPRGFTTQQLEEIMGDSLRLQKIKALLGATNDPAPTEVRAMYERRNQKTESSVIRLKLEDFKKDVKVTDEDVQKRFEERKAALLHEETRKVKFVAFTVAKSDKPLVGKDRVVAMQKLADQASEFAVALAEKGAKLDEVAAKFSVKVEETPEFEVGDAPAELGESEIAAQAAFKLTAEEPNSEVVTTENGYYVLQLANVTPSKPMTFDESKKRLTDEITTERATESLSLKATEFRTKITEAIKAGKSYADAATEAGAAPVAFPVFSQAEPKMDAPDAREIMQRAADLAEGQVSDFIPTADGGLILHIDKRLPVDEAGFEKEKTMLAQGIDRTKKEAAFQQWMKERRGAAGLVDAKG